jgi:cytochrome b subunit of formate dehydrogenase
MTAEAKITQGLSTKKCVLVTLSVAIAVLAVLGTISMMTPELWTGMFLERFKITDVQFSEGLLEVTVKNLGDDGAGYQGVGVELVTVAEVKACS